MRSVEDSRAETKERASFDIQIVDVELLSEEDKETLMHLHIAEYPTFAELYQQNKYFSSIEPQMVGIIRHEGRIVGTGKFLWKDLKVNDLSVRLCCCGLSIAKEYQGQGLGLQLLDRFIEKTGEVQGDLLYASTTSPIVEHILVKRGFRKIAIPVVSEHRLIHKEVRQIGESYAYEITPRHYREYRSTGRIKSWTRPRKEVGDSRRYRYAKK